MKREMATSAVYQVDARDLPQELRVRPQWVNWRVEERDGKPTKVPYQCGTGVKASSTEPATWGSFTTACAFASTHPEYGIGFVFSADDPYCGVDLDHCRDPETGEIDVWAQKIITALDSY